MRIALACLALAVAAPAYAQSGPGFDCAKPSSEVELAVCATPELTSLHAKMAAAYAALAGKLSGPARDHLAKEQQRLVAYLNESCVGSRDEVVGCLRDNYQARLNNLRIFGEGVYPFVSTQYLNKKGKVGKISYTIDASWPRFDGTSADFSEINRRYAERANKAAGDVIPKDTSAGDLRGEQDWSYDQSFELQRPSGSAVAVAVNFDGFAGGAHGFAGTDAQLVDLRTGRAAGPAEVFGSGDHWLDVLVPLVRADLKKQFSDDKPGFDDAIEPAKLAKLLREPGHYLWRRDSLQLIFNAYVVGPYVSGQFTVDIPYATLKPLFAAGGPMGDRR